MDAAAEEEGRGCTAGKNFYVGYNEDGRDGTLSRQMKRGNKVLTKPGAKTKT